MSQHETGSLPSKSSRLSAQQRAVLVALTMCSVAPSTATLRNVRVRYGDAFPNYHNPDKLYAIGEPVGAVLRRLKRRGLVEEIKPVGPVRWRITDEGCAAIGFSR